MKKAYDQNERIAKMTFASVYPHYVTKVEKKGRTKAELHQVIKWLTTPRRCCKSAFRTK